MKISVAMCTYNGASFVRDQLDSMLRQTRTPDELVICDDCSEDDTVAILEAWRQAAPFPVTIEVNPERLGSTGNFAKAIAMCGGDVIALSDQDDVWLDHKLAEAESAFSSNADLGLWFTDALLVDETLRLLHRTLWKSVDFDASSQGRLLGKERLETLLRCSFVTGATLVFRARYLALVLPIPQDLHFFIHDRWIATMIGAVAPVEFSCRPSMLYRQHPRQQIGAGERRRILGTLSARLSRYSQNYAQDLRTAELVAERLSGAHGVPVPERARKTADERVALLRMRSSLPRRRWRRLPPVAQALAQGQYHRHGAGLASAIKDLFL